LPDNPCGPDSHTEDTTSSVPQSARAIPLCQEEGQSAIALIAG
jgi:hypothetical protein